MPTRAVLLEATVPRCARTGYWPVEIRARSEISVSITASSQSWRPPPYSCTTLRSESRLSGGLFSWLLTDGKKEPGILKKAPGRLKGGTPNPSVRSSGFFWECITYFRIESEGKGRRPYRSKNPRDEKSGTGYGLQVKHEQSSGRRAVNLSASNFISRPRIPVGCTRLVGASLFEIAITGSRFKQLV